MYGVMQSTFRNIERGGDLVMVIIIHTLKINVHLFVMQYGSRRPSGYTPVSNTISVEVNGSAGGCSGLTPQDTGCSVSISPDGVYSVTLNQTNHIGTTTSVSTFLCE